MIYTVTIRTAYKKRNAGEIWLKNLTIKSAPLIIVLKISSEITERNINCT
jgi:hypothetical protein